MNGTGEVVDDLTYYRFAQAFGERATTEAPQEADLISAVQFSRTGDLIATGDKGGRVVVLQRIDAGRGEALRREQLARATRRFRLVQRETNRVRAGSSSCSSQGRISTGMSPVPVPRSPRIAVVGPRWPNGRGSDSFRHHGREHDHRANYCKSTGRHGVRTREPYLDDSSSDAEGDSSDTSSSEAGAAPGERALAAGSMEMVSPPAVAGDDDDDDDDLELNECDVLMTSCSGEDDLACRERSRERVFDTIPSMRATRAVSLEAEAWDCRERASDGRNADIDESLRPDVSRIPAFVPEYRFWTQFQSHEPEFDYLKSLEIEEKINQIRWCRDVSGAHRLLTTNDKTIKLWRVFERKVRQLETFDHVAIEADTRLEPHRAPTRERSQAPLNGSSLGHLDLVGTPGSNGLATAGTVAGREVRLPRLRRTGTMVMAVPKRVFANAHAYHINSISLNSDEETFLSADDLRINIWNLDICSTGFNVVDIKPENMEDLTEVITAAEFHPQHCNLFLYSSSRGVLKLCDLRTRALCDQCCREYEEPEDPANRSFFSEIIASTSDLAFSHSGRYVLARDYMTVKLWDITMEKRPLLTIPVHESLRSRLCELYENDCIFDKFQCAFSADDASILTGSYGNQFQVYSSKNGRGLCYEASVDFVSSGRSPRLLFPNGVSGSIETMTDASGSMGAVSSSPSTLATTANNAALGTSSTSGATEPLLPTQSPTARRVLHVASHPLENIAAVAAGPALYLYNAVSSPYLF
ncbi:protein phosphatase 2, regulatory subunit B [Cyanidiococcus yangmingshanensis]|uniref:Protein phosphatase 2, regulatory subunit B n=1 Tax=Cyanidiococcus yangmingshanensis TaxID=2690220 RepID=A0A7J7IJU6_9RHOD|nr:protein phosphatase 2, regulatory subunit B [Cyanidiococcus yangmingshanensis]